MGDKLKQYAEFCSNFIVLSILLLLSILLCYFSNLLGKAIPVTNTIFEHFNYYFNNLQSVVKYLFVNLGAAVMLISLGIGVIGLNFRFEFEKKALKIITIIFGSLIIIVPGFMFLGRFLVVLITISIICVAVFFVMDAFFSDSRSHSRY